MLTISKTDYEKPRKPSELVTYRNHVREKFGATKEGKSAMRLQSDPIVQKFVSELWPLASFVQHVYLEREDLLFSVLLSDGPDDAVATYAKSGAPAFSIQITQALDSDAGEQEHLRMLHLDKYGHAPITGVKLKRVKGVVPEMWEEAEAREKTRDVLHRRIQQRVESKSKGFVYGTMLFPGGRLKTSKVWTNSCVIASWCPVRRFAPLLL
jgi:hypothetical protein